MRSLLTVVVVVAFALTFAGTLAADRFAVFQLGDIKGEHKGDDYSNWIDVLFFEHNMPGLTSGPLLLAGENPNKTEMSYTPPDTYSGFTCVKEVDKSSPKIAQTCERGRQFPSMKLALCSKVDGKTTPLAEYHMFDALITSVTLLAPGHGDRPEGVDEDKAVQIIKIRPKKLAWSWGASQSGTMH